ncbi:hypothetical protein ACJX0J_007732 [Zea mays]
MALHENHEGKGYIGKEKLFTLMLVQSKLCESFHSCVGSMMLNLYDAHNSLQRRTIPSSSPHAILPAFGLTSDLRWASVDACKSDTANRLAHLDIFWFGWHIFMPSLDILISLVGL